MGHVTDVLLRLPGSCQGQATWGRGYHRSFFSFSLLPRSQELNGMHLSHGVGSSPLFRGLYGSRLILLPALGDVVGERVVGVRGTQQGLD